MNIRCVYDSVINYLKRMPCRVRSDAKVKDMHSIMPSVGQIRFSDSKWKFKSSSDSALITNKIAEVKRQQLLQFSFVFSSSSSSSFVYLNLFNGKLLSFYLRAKTEHVIESKQRHNETIGERMAAVATQSYHA